MNILIVTSHRCGSLSLANWLKREVTFNGPDIDEDTSYKIINNTELNTLEHINDVFSNIDNSIMILLFEDYIKLVKDYDFLPEEKFDFTICLKRISSKLQAESYLYNKNKPYFITNDWIDKNKKELKKLEVKFQKEYKLMDTVFGFHANYESVFDKDETPQDLWNIAAYIGIRPAFYWIIKPAFKLRRFTKINLI
jgi:hypothetical protein